MTSESIRIEQQLYPAGHRDRHTPHVCTACGHPMPSDGTCTHCEAPAPGTASERPILRFPDARARLD
ncbi:MAG TPA: hypothetical protein VI300_22960 [Solirubrobacter sp.]